MEIVFNKDEFARLLAKAMGDRSINRYALHSQVSATYISKLLRGIVEKPPGAAVIRKLADKAQNTITYEELMRAAGHLAQATHENKSLVYELREVSPVYNCNIISLPIISSITAGIPILSEKTIEGYMDFPANLADGAAFVLRVHGDNMTGVSIYNGDYVVVKQQPIAESGQTVVVRTDGAVTIKRFYQLNSKIRLEPADGGYKPIEAQNIEIIGVVLALIRKFI